MDEILKEIGRRERFLIVSHSRPDGDSIGTSLGLGLALEELGKRVEWIQADPPPDVFRFLPGIDRIRISNRAEGDYDALLVLECGAYERTEIQGLDSYFTINIDHHPKNDRFGNLNWIDPKAAAVAEMAYRLLKALPAEISPEVATNLYVGILTDTGSFRFASTTAETFRIASELVGSGADPGTISQMLFMNHPASRMRLLTKLLETLDFTPDGTVSWIHLSQRMLQEAGASLRDTEGLVNYALGVSGVQVCAFFREEGRRQYRVSLRAKADVSADVGQVAELFGGGGHAKAAGLSVEGEFEEVRSLVVSRLLETLQAKALSTTGTRGATPD